MKRTLSVALMVMLLLIMAAGCAKSGNEPAEVEPDNTAGRPIVYEGEGFDSTLVASCGEYGVTMADYTFFYRAYQWNNEYEARMYGFSDDTMHEFWDQQQGESTYRKLLGDMALMAAKEYSVLYALAVKSGAVENSETNAASDAQIDEMLALVNNDEEAFKKEYYMAPQLMRTMYHNMNLLDAYQNSIKETIEISDQEIQAEYEANLDLYDTVTVRHVLITSDTTMSEEEQEAAKAKAEDILKQLENGADIGALAAEFSEDPGSKDNNGEYTFGKGEMVEEFESWAFAAAPGDRGIVQTSYGHHVMEMIGRSSFDEEMKSAIREQMRDTRKNEIIDEKLKEAAEGEWDENILLLATVSVDMTGSSGETSEPADANSSQAENSGGEG